MYARIVVPLDGSELAERVLPTAEAFARLAGAAMHLIRVVDTVALQRIGGYGLAIEYGAMQTVLADEAAAAGEYLAGIQADLTARGLTVTTESPLGAVVSAITATARPDDLLVMATHGRGGMARWFLGSVAEAVVRQATVPVLLVRVVESAAHSTTK